MYFSNYIPNNIQCPAPWDFACGTLLSMLAVSMRGHLCGGLRSAGGRPAGTRLHPRVTPARRLAIDVGCTLIVPPLCALTSDRHWWRVLIRSCSVLTACRQGRKAFTASSHLRLQAKCVQYTGQRKETEENTHINTLTDIATATIQWRCSCNQYRLYVLELMRWLTVISANENSVHELFAYFILYRNLLFCSMLRNWVKLQPQHSMTFNECDFFFFLSSLEEG